MVFVSITRLRLKSILHLIPFFWHTYKSTKQLTAESKFIKGKTLMDQKLTFWTLTLWNSDADMRAYRNSGMHIKAMPKLQHWCDEASVVHWQQDTDEFPTWGEAYEQMKTKGRPSKVKKPSQDHLSFQFPAPKPPYRTEQKLFPKVTKA